MKNYITAVRSTAALGRILGRLHIKSLVCNYTVPADFGREPGIRTMYGFIMREVHNFCDRRHSRGVKKETS